jgi:hypothetical protein
MVRIPGSDPRLPQRENELAIVRELENLLQGDVGQENVVLPIDGNAVRHHKHVRAPRRNEFAGAGVDLEHRRFGQFGGCLDVEPPTRSMENKHVSIHVDSDASSFAKLNAGRKARPILYFFITRDCGRGSYVIQAGAEKGHDQHQTRHHRNFVHSFDHTMHTEVLPATGPPPRAYVSIK